MDKLYLTVKRSNEKGLPYQSQFSGEAGLHYDAEGLLYSVAETIVSHRDHYFVFRNNLPEEEAALRGTLDTMVLGHNMALKIGTQPPVPGQEEARKFLKKAGES